MSSKTQEISVIENKYGLALFRMGLISGIPDISPYQEFRVIRNL